MQFVHSLLLRLAFVLLLFCLPSCQSSQASTLPSTDDAQESARKGEAAAVAKSQEPAEDQESQAANDEADENEKDDEESEDDEEEKDNGDSIW